MVLNQMPTQTTRPLRFRLALCAGLIGMAWHVAGAAEPATPNVDFNRDVRPILSDNCFACHGPDDAQRKGGLRLDTKEGAFAALEDGGHAVIPGEPEESELVARVEADEPDVRMPPKSSRKSLTADQVGLLRRWVAQGAPWSNHWAFDPPSRPDLPRVSDPAWPRDPIDRFILARLDTQGLRPSPEADRPTLIRRLSLDLTGLPPTLEEVDAFSADDAPDAYEKLVDRLLRSPRFGEHHARFWLDAARYGDTHGLHLDNYREIWPYREWVIRAFNDNKPFDRFIVEQLAGDLLPNPTLDQLVATGFNRCHVSTSEGGSIEEEVYVRNVVDQVDTNGTVFLGLTVGCCRCHDHKFDPIRQKEYYQLFAFFNNLDGPALDGNSDKPPPSIKVPTAEQRAAIEHADQKVAAIRSEIVALVANVAVDDGPSGEFVRRVDHVWIDDAPPAGSKVAVQGAPPGSPDFAEGPDHPVRSGARAVLGRADGLGQHVYAAVQEPLIVGPGDVLFADVFLDPTRPSKEIMLQWFSDGWKHRAYWGENLIPFGRDGTTERVALGPLPTDGRWVHLEVPAAKVGLKAGTKVNGWAFTQHGGTVYWDRAGIETWTPQPGQTFDSLAAWIAAQRASGASGLPKEVAEAVKLDRAQRSDVQKKQVHDYFAEHAYTKSQALLEPLRRRLAEAEVERQKIEAEAPTTLVFKERADLRPAFILNRGEYDQRRDPVERGTPAFLPPLPSDAPKNRLGFARWLIAPENPLTARVAVNRFWQQVFGTGLVKTAEDFGSQGEPPSHPELLDSLAIDFRESGWDVKALVKRLVMSATYRQGSRATPDRLAKDPDNRLLSRGPRFRLDAEMLRDQALFDGGLLVERIGGPSVKPPQPAGLWEAVGYTSSNTAKFVADTGAAKVHRRGLYTFWKRTSAPPQMTTFDAPSREACTVRRERTNTPMQALLLMNGPQFIEASRALGARALRHGGSTTEERLAYLFRLATSRAAQPGEMAELASALAGFKDRFDRDPEAAKKLIAIGESRPDPALDPAELAAWTMIGNLVLNLDEVLNKS